MKYALLLILGFAVVPGLAQADTYHRFWRGTQLSSLSKAQFSDGLNQVFLSATVRVGAGKGLIAYEPVLLEGLAKIADEVALVSYADKSAYDSLYATEAGKTYQNLHWQYFEKALSHSLTPSLYSGKVGIEQAYDLHPEYADWQKNTTSVMVSLRRSGESDAQFLGRVTRHLDQSSTGDAKNGILDRVVLVAQGYWIEYASGTRVPADSVFADYLLPVKSDVPGSAKIVVGAGVNLQF